MAHRALRAAVLAFLPSLALAQTSAVTLNIPQVNQLDCAGSRNILVTWTLATAFNAGTDTVRVTAFGSCPATAPAENGSATLGADVTALQATQSQSFPVSKIKTAVTADCASASDTPVSICVYLITGGSNGASATVGSATFTFQTAVPPAPRSVSASPANSAIEVSWSAGSTDSTYQADSLDYEVEVKLAGADGGSYVSAGRGLTSPARIGNLVNGQTYTARVYAWSAVASPSVGNRGPPSAEASATPDNFLDFWSAYKNDGGQEAGGCGAGAAGALATLIVAFALFLRRRA